MVISAVEKELMQYFTELDEPQKKSLLEMIKAFLKPDNEPEERITTEQYNQELDEAMERITKGEFTTLDQLEKEMQSW